MYMIYDRQVYLSEEGALHTQDSARSQQNLQLIQDRSDGYSSGDQRVWIHPYFQ